MINQALIDKKWFIKSLKSKNLIKKIEKIKLVTTDIDGALTNTKILITETGICKSFSVQDGFITDKTLQKKDLFIAFLSGRNDQVTHIRAKMLGLPDNMCHIGLQKKEEKLKLVQKLKNVSEQDTLHFGDDFLDFEIKKFVGLFACPANTPFYFQQQADLIIPRVGGNDSFRLLLDLILYVQKKHFAMKYIDSVLKK